MPILVPKKCMDGKTRMKPIRGFDCIYFKWHEIPYTWSECSLKKGHDPCNYRKNPFECQNFKIKDKYTEVVEWQLSKQVIKFPIGGVANGN